MIDPKTSLQEIFIQYPSLRLLYEQKGEITDDSITTEQFCDRNDIPLLEFWMNISRETNQINIQKSKEQKISKKAETPKTKYVRFRDLPEEVQVRIVFYLLLSIAGLILYIVAWQCNFGHWIKTLCVIITVICSTRIASLTNKKYKR